jgi:hypothetical protein
VTSKICTYAAPGTEQRCGLHDGDDCGSSVPRLVRHVGRFSEFERGDDPRPRDEQAMPEVVHRLRRGFARCSSRVGASQKRRCEVSFKLIIAMLGGADRIRRKLAKLGINQDDDDAPAVASTYSTNAPRARETVRAVASACSGRNGARNLGRNTRSVKAARRMLYACPCAAGLRHNLADDQPC